MDLKKGFKMGSLSLRTKSLIIIFITGLGLILILYAASQSIFLKSAADLEKQDTSRNVERAVNALKDNISALESIVGDWAPWDDTYVFVEDLNDSYIENNLNAATLVNLGVNFILFANSSGELVYGKAIDLQNESEVPVPQSIAGYLSGHDRLIQHPDTESSISGIILVPEDPVLIASQPILTSANEGPIHGTLLMGRYLDTAEIDRLAETTQLSLATQRFDETQLSSDFEVARLSLSDKTPVFVQPLNNDTVAGYALLKDVYGKPVLMLRADIPRDIYQQGQDSLKYFLISLLGVGLIFGIVAVLLLSRLVLSPLSRLSAGVAGIAASGDPSARVVMTGSGELAKLSGYINNMLVAVDNSHKALQESEEKFKRLVEDMGDGYFVVQGYRLVYANNRSAEMFGSSVTEVVNKPIGELLIPDLVEELSKWHYKRLRGEMVPQQYEVTLVRNDGKVVDVEFSARRMYYEGRPAVSVVMRDITERKKAQEALRQSEEHYATLVKSLTDAVFKLRGGVITWCNDRVEAIYGYKREELIGKPAEALFPEGVTHSQFIKDVSSTIKERGYFRSSGIVKKKDGSLTYVEYTISEMPDTKPRELVAVARDITERKRIEEAVAKSEAKYRSLVETTSAGVAIIDLKGEFILVNEALCNMVGYSQKELIGWNFANFLYPDDKDKLLGQFTEAFIGKDEHPVVEFRTIHKDGHIVWLYSSPTPLVHENETIGFSAIIHDITERKRTEEALRLSEERFRSVLDNSLDMIYSLNLRTGRYEYVSPASEKVLGYNPEEFIGHSLELARSTIHPDDMQRLDENFVELLAAKGETAERIQYRVKHKEGGYRWVSDSRSLVCDNGHTPVAVVGSMRDITERKQEEEKLNRIMAELARSNTELEQFAYIASHDLQEPLRMVASYTQLLARRYKGKLDADADEFIGYAVDGATRMQQLINALLDYSRVGTRAKPLEPTDCEAVFSNAIANLGAAIKETEAVVTHDHLPTVTADATQMVQVFQNLLGNSIKFHSEKRPEIHVGAHRNGSEWIFSVRDNGIGIDPKYFERIFIIFQRLHGRNDYPGTGIGLALCKKIVERHKGRIWVESESGKGATFYFTIPMGGEEKS